MNSFFFPPGVAVSILLATTHLNAQAPPPPSRPPPPEGAPEPRELREMREQFTLRALAAGRTLAEQYAAALATLESQAAESSDYETALAAQQRRNYLAEHYANRDPDPASSILLKPGDAKTTGAVALDKSDNTLTNWRTVGSSATWDVFKIAPGTYTVSLTCGVADLPQAGGDLEFGEVTSLGGAELARLAVTLKSTGDWSTFETIELGEIKLARTSARFAIKASRLRGTAGLMHLKEIRLTPARLTAKPPDKELAQDLADEFERLSAAHQSKLRELEQPVLSAYLAKLASLGDELAARKDDDGAQAVLAEAKRAERSLRKPDKTVRTPHGSVSAEGLEEVHDAAFVEDPTNTGDRFLITARGEKLSVKLMSVTCPSPNPEDKALHDFHARYFGISREDSILIGRLARDFTTAYLKDKPLKLLTRWQKDKNGSVLAAVLPGEIGDLAGILVDNGLAAVLEPASKNAAQRQVEEDTHSVLKQRETDAKAKPAPPGAWSLAGEIKPAP
jgi:hypothetical protein